MFGYINVNASELKVREFVRYRAFYCGLCRSLKERCGLGSRAVLSYDMTFLAILLSSLYEPKVSVRICRCAAHPLKKHKELRSEYTDYAADMNVLASWFLASDKIQDARETGFLDAHHMPNVPGAADLAAGGSLKAVLLPAMKRIRSQYPEKVRNIESYIGQLRNLELSAKEQGFPDYHGDPVDPDSFLTNKDAAYYQLLEKACSLNGMITAEFFAVREDMWTRDLREIGYHLGRFIYLMDAFEDIERDIRQENFNPLLPLYQEDTGNFSSACLDYMNIAMASCAAAFERLPLLKDAEILRNIIYAGVFSKYNAICRKRQKNKGE